MKDDGYSPVIEEIQSTRATDQRPVSADTAFTPHALEATDVVLTMYMIKVLPVLKHVGFDIQLMLLWDYYHSHFCDHGRP